MDHGIQELVSEYEAGHLTRRGFVASAGALGLSAALAATMAGQVEARAAGRAGTTNDSPAAVIWRALSGGDWEIVDLSVTTDANYPVNWPTDPQFNIIPVTWFEAMRGPNGENSAIEAEIYATQRYELNEHTGTQIDFPPHFIPPPGVDVPGASGNRWGRMTGDKYPLKAFMGPAVVVDVRDLLDANTTPGTSAHMTAAWLRRWEQANGRLSAGDVPLLFSGYTDRHFEPFPSNDRFADRMLWKPIVEGSTPGWVVADPGAVELMHDRGVDHVVTDGPSFGAVEDGQPSHVAGLSKGMTYTEMTIGLGRLPLRGAFYVMAPYKVRDQQAGIGRAFALKPTGVAGVGA